MARDSSGGGWLPFELRAYRSGDFERLYQIDRACYPRGICYPRPVLRRFISARGANTLVAESGGGVAGFIIVMNQGLGRGHVITIDVLADFRRAGLGSALLEAGEAWLVGQCVRTVELETSVENTAAIALFQRFGYQVVRYLPDYYRNHADAYLMEKALPQLV